MKSGILILVFNEIWLHSDRHIKSCIHQMRIPYLSIFTKLHRLLPLQLQGSQVQKEQIDLT